MDIIDEANSAAEQHLSKAIERARAGLAAELPENDTCEECGDTIPAARRNAVPGCRTCLTCQEQIEERRRKR